MKVQLCGSMKETYMNILQARLCCTESSFSHLEHRNLWCCIKSLAVEILYKSSFLCSETNTPSENTDQQPIYSDETISNIVDALLRNSDLNNDGFIDYAEFKQTENKWQGSSIWTVHIEWVAHVLCCKSEVSSLYIPCVIYQYLY
jgi:hypothetical protein